MIEPAALYIFSLGMLSFIICMLLVIGILLIIRRRYSMKRKKLKPIYNDFITEIILCETEEELQQVFEQQTAQLPASLFKHPYNRKVFRKEIMLAKGSLSGIAAQNLKWLYEKLNFTKDNLAAMTSKKWHKKAAAIQQLSAMNQKKYLLKIYRETNNENLFIRNEAQIAVVSFTGFNGLRFLNIIHHPLTQWQQLCLLQKLNDQDVDVNSLSMWLHSSNETVVEFALRLIEKFKCFEMHDAVLELLHHSSLAIREQSLLTVREIADEKTSFMIAELFFTLTKKERRLALEIITEHSGKHQLSFLTALAADTDEAIRFNSLKAIEKISPAWRRYISIKSKKADVIYINQLKKEIV